jgi:hypothetical protein
MLTRAVLCADTDGVFTLVEVPFSWQRGDPLPPGTIVSSFQTAAEALATLANRGRMQARVTVPKPEPSTQSPETKELKETDREQYLKFVEHATRWRDLPSPP